MLGYWLVRLLKTCRIFVSPPLSFSFSLFQLFPPPASYGNFTSSYQQTVQINSPLILSCGSIRSIPSPNYLWSYFDNTNIVPDINGPIKGIDGDLYFRLLNENNIDKYRCTVINPLTEVTKFCYINLIRNGEFHIVYSKL